MRKVILAIVLLAMVVGLSYFKSIREDAQREAALDEVRQSAQQDQAAVASSIDSLEARWRDSTSALHDSLARISNAYSGEIDSLTSELVRREKIMTAMQDSLDAAIKRARAKAQQAQQAQKAGDSADFHLKVLTFYNKQFKELPHDLSDYERQVALKEIRIQTAREFSISVEAVNDIRHASNLTF